jgi:hypothetical protein
MQARFPGTCNACGSKFPKGADIDWTPDQGAKHANCPTAPQAAPQADRAFIVDGAMKMEWVEEKTYQEGVAFQGDSVIYEERVYSGYNWMCFECKLVWDKQHQAKNCGKRDHVTAYEDTYGVREVENGIPKGNNMYSITRKAIRREKSKDTPPVAPAPVDEIPKCDQCGQVFTAAYPAQRDSLFGKQRWVHYYRGDAGRLGRCLAGELW